MPTYVSNKTVMAVRDLLRLAGTPMTTKEIALALGKSYEAVRQAVTSADLVTVGHGNPKLYALAEVDQTRRVPSKNNGLDYTVAGVEIAQLVPEWNKSKGDILAKLADSEILPGTNPMDLATRLGTASGVLAQLSYDLSSVAHQPDWYEILTETE